MTSVLGLITARGGSKSIPHKNVALLAGRPLLAYTCAAAQGSRHVARTVLSTDDECIARVGHECGVEVPFQRPAELASDQAKSIDVALHALDWLSEQERFEPDILLLLQPTSPFRTSAHIDEALDLMVEKEADTVVSVIEVPHRYTPYSIMRQEGPWLRDFWEGPLPFDRFRRQEVPHLYARNGPVVLATRVNVLREKRSFYGDKVAAYLMNETDSVDIDSPMDLRWAEFLMSQSQRGS